MRKLHIGITIAGITFVCSLLTVTATQIAAKRFSADSNVGVIPMVPISRILTPRFLPTGRGCGMGYIQGYETSDGQKLGEGVRWNPKPNVVKLKVAKFVRDAKQVVERQPDFRYGGDSIGERIVIVNRPDESGEESVSILYYDGSDSYKFIDAPTLELAEEFEQYLISINFASPI
jgi:hypothetical protein